MMTSSRFEMTSGVIGSYLSMLHAHAEQFESNRLDSATMHSLVRMLESGCMMKHTCVMSSVMHHLSRPAPLSSCMTFISCAACHLVLAMLTCFMMFVLNRWLHLKPSSGF